MYPAPLSINILIGLFASLQSSLLALFLARDVKLWKIEWDVKLLAVIYGGIVVSGLAYYLVLQCISKRGPVFAAMFTPLQLPIVGVFSAIVFNERLHIGSLIGALIIIIGLYSVLWGKTKDNVVKSPEIKDVIVKEDKGLDIIINNDGTMRSSPKTEH